MNARALEPFLNMTASGASSEEHTESLRSNSDPDIKPTPRSHPRQHVVTSVLPKILTSTANSNNSSRVSLVSNASQPPITNTSFRLSPEGLQAMPLLSSSFPGPMYLPEAYMPSSTPTSPPMMSPNAMSDAVSIGKGNGLMRRLSRGAHNKIVRRRPSTTSQNRDVSVGPAIMRRRSDSNRGIFDSGVDVSDFDLDSHDEEAIEDLAEQYIFGASHPFLRSDTNSGTVSTRPSIGSLDSGWAPTFPHSLYSKAHGSPKSQDGNGNEWYSVSTSRLGKFVGIL